MQLISQLNEASGIPIDDLKKVMSRDARVKQVFSKTLDLENISSKVEFVQTLKFFLLNNRNVIDFVESRDYVKAVDKRTLKRLRELKPIDLKQKDLDDLLQFANDLFREHAHVERSGMSPHLRKELLNWVNANGRYFDLSRGSQKELESLPNIRPTRPVVLYRGLLFSSSDLRELKRYDGQLEVGKGLQFLRSIREGTRIVDLEWDRASSWSTDKQVATQFAKFGSASSNFSATMQWLDRSSKGKAIDGDLGFIISTLAQPEDVLIDIQRMITTAHMKHGNESEVILRPGTYTSRVSVKFTKEGEVPPIASSTLDGNNASIEAVREFGSTWMNDHDWADLSDGGFFRYVDVENKLSNKNVDSFLKLMSGKIKSEAIEAYSELKEFYDEHLANLTDAEVDELLVNPKIVNIAQWVKELREYMNSQDVHPAFKTSDNNKGRVKHKELSSEQARESQFSRIADHIKNATVGGRYTDAMTGRSIELLSKAFGGSSEKDVHRKGRKDQEEIFDKTLAGFFKAANDQMPADRDEAIKKFRNAVLAAERNAGMISKIMQLKRELDKVLGSKSRKDD